MIRRFRIQQQKIELNHYEGSLDFPCDFCGNSSYNNFQISKDGQLEFVFCQECLEKVYNVISTENEINSQKASGRLASVEETKQSGEACNSSDIHSTESVINSQETKGYAQSGTPPDIQKSENSPDIHSQNKELLDKDYDGISEKQFSRKQNTKLKSYAKDKGDVK